MFTYLLSLYRVVGIVLCIYANFCYYGPVIGILKHRLPEATCSVNVVLLVMCCMCIPAFIVTSADISQLWVILPSCCYLQTCNVYGVWVTLYCICVQTFVTFAYTS